MQIEIHPEASEEMDQARLWYEKQSGGLGEEFLDEIDRAIHKIQQWPEAWTPYWHDVRRFLMHRFPYVIYYRYKNDKIQIFAVAHLRRKPGYWKSRNF